MRILFIYPNADSQLGFHYGIAHLSSVLKKAGHEVTLWQLCEDIAPLPSRSEFIDRLRKEAPDVIGFSVVTNQWRYTTELAAWAKDAVPATLICGGIHAMAAPEQVLESGLFDYIMRGEAEHALLEFVQKLDSSEDVSAVRNLGWIDTDGIHLNPVRALPRLNDLPFKDYDIFDFQKLIDAKDGWVGLMASRGCPFACTYCFNHQMVKNYRNDLDCSFKELNYIRHFEVDGIIAEIKYLLANYSNIKMFIFDDDLFTFYSDYVKAFSDAYQKVSSLPFVVNAHVGFFDEQRARYLAAAGCKIVKFGVESGSSRIRRQVMRRHMKNESIIAAIRTAAQLDLHTSVFLMIGLPDESYDDVMATIKLMAAALPGRYRWTFFYPYPNTAAYDIAFEKGYVDEARLARIKNFTDQSGLDFGEEHNLFLEKVGKVMPWFVNAHSDLPVAGFYREKTTEILALGKRAWRKRSERILDEDRAFSDRFVREGLSHYAIKYNPFMGVISDYFTAEAEA
jgi:radical SAM superfamily enzyme YgiQ (UPF0313 family)